MVTEHGNRGPPWRHEDALSCRNVGPHSAVDYGSK